MNQKAYKISSLMKSASEINKNSEKQQEKKKIGDSSNKLFQWL